MWARLLQAMGRALVPEKCFWYLLHPVWCKGKWVYSHGKDQHALMVVNDENSKVIIHRLSPLEASQSLGVHLAPDGNNMEEFMYLCATASQWCTAMATAKMTHVAVEFGMHHVILKKLEYLLPATTFSCLQCTQILQPILTQGLP